LSHLCQNGGAILGKREAGNVQTGEKGDTESLRGMQKSEGDGPPSSEAEKATKNQWTYGEVDGGGEGVPGSEKKK